MRTFDVGECKYCYKQTLRGEDPFEDCCVDCSLDRHFNNEEIKKNE